MANAIHRACPRATIRFIIIVYETLRPRPITNFSLARATLANETQRHERLYENLVFDSDRGGVHGFPCRRQAELQNERQELSHERQQGVQLREKLRLRQVAGVYRS